jgi:hypothetical protein
MAKGTVVNIPSSLGEAVDRLTILKVKAARIGGGDSSTQKQLSLLLKEMKGLSFSAEQQMELLEKIHSILWDAEDIKRLCEREQRFDRVFLIFARLVYLLNDLRALLKKEIDDENGALFSEEKKYTEYE